MSLRVIKPGIQDSIQDMGRFGFRHLGINPGGAMDKYALQLSNCLVGNAMNEAVLELHFPAGTFFFEQPTLIAISGGDFSPAVNGDPVPSLQPVLVSKYSILQFEKASKGARAYLAIYGGLGIVKWLNSASTNLKIGINGLLGRSLQANDEIPVNSYGVFQQILDKKEFMVLPWKADSIWSKANSEELMILPGPEWDLLGEDAQKALLNGNFTISNRSDRMGYHLTGETLLSPYPQEMISSAVDFGTVQLLPDGQLIVLMADHQTTGGYPRIAHVIAAEQSRLAQKHPGESFRFVLSTQQNAEALLFRQQQHLQQVQNACKFRLEEFLSV